jgi:hypothetical protein
MFIVENNKTFTKNSKFLGKMDRTHFWTPFFLSKVYQRASEQEV